MKVISVNVSDKKGVIKHPVEEIILSERGIINDAHSGEWHRQVSMLGTDSVAKFAKMAGREINCGEFAENITTEGFLIYETSPLDRFVNKNVELEVTQIGKKCHGDRCAIYTEVGNCVMPKEGIFCRVVRTGKIKAGDNFEYIPKIFKARVVTLSDRASSGEYTDRSGPRVKELLENFMKENKMHYQVESTIIPDDKDQLQKVINESIRNNVDFIFTTGGTGVAERDITPEVVGAMLEKEIPGIMEMIRMKYGAEKPNALLSRAVAGVIGKTQVYTLPGSVRAVNEYMTEILKTLHHLVLMLHGIDAH